MIPNDLIHILKDVSDEILNARDVHSLAKAAHQIVERFVPVPFSGIYLWIPSENRISLLYAQGFTDEENEVNEQTAMERHPGHVFKSREVLYITDMHADEIPSYVRDNKRRNEIRSRLWMPICTETKSLGSFGFASEKPDFFTQVHRDVLEYICRLVANQYIKMLQSEAEAEYAKKLNDAYLKVNEAFRVQSQFTAKMNHELRTPLNSILGLLRILEQSQLEQNQKESIQLIREQSQLLLRLVNDVLDISKIQDNEFRVVQFEMNLKSLLSEIVRVMEVNAVNKGLRLVVNIDEEIPEFIQSDELRLRQILNNLLGNALKFTNQGSISLEVKRHEENDIEYLAFIVSDTGIGIHPEKLPHIFDRFFQASNEIEITYGGSGLGLTIVKEIIDRLGGTIQALSEPDKGTTFIVNIPLLRSNELVSTEPTIDDTIDLESRRILIVEDNPINGHFLSHILNEKGASIKLVTDGQQALDLLRADQDFDLILMDVRMPLMDGIECTKILRTELHLKIPVIVQSGNTIERDIEQCYAVGADDFVSKPINEKELYRKILKHSNVSSKRKKSDVNLKVDLNDALIKLFENAITEFIELMEKAIDSEDIQVIQFELHKLKSSLKQLGYEELSTTAIFIENQIINNANQVSILDQCKDFLKRIKVLKQEITTKQI